MLSLEAACKEAEKKLELVKKCSLPLSRPQDFHDFLGNTDLKPFSIFEKLEELYKEECFRNLDNTTGIKSNSFLLEKLVTRERLNTLILSLYPEKNEYTFALRMGSILEDINIGNHTDENIIKMTWHPDDEILSCIDNEELPTALTDIFEEEHPELFYSGCIIVEVRDYQQINSQVSCETHHVLLKPTNQSLINDFNSVIDKSCDGWTDDEKLMIESELINATNATLCLDPNPSVSILINRIHHQRNLFNTYGLRKCAQRFALVSRKRKLETISPNPGLELHDFIMKKRLKSTKSTSNSLSKLKPPRMVLPAPSLETKRPLALPDNVNTSKFRYYPGPRDTKNCMPHLIEEYILDTDRQCERDLTKIYHLHIKLSILQRPFNSEYLGELYLDVDYKEGKTNGASSRFILGSRSYVDKFIRQFTDMLTKNGRKSMKIIKRVPGQDPRYIRIPGMIDKAVEAAQQAQDHAARQAVKAVQLQSSQPQIISGQNSLANGNATPNVVLVQNQSTSVQNNTSSVPILQAQLQSTSQPKLDPRHTANPEISALVASFINEAHQIEQEAAAAAAAAAQQAAAAAALAQEATQQQLVQQQQQQQQQQPTVATNANAAILSLLNTSPVNNVNSATSAAVANAITNSNNLGSVVQQQQPHPQQQQQTLNQKMLGRKMTIANVPRVLNHGNVITVNNSNLTGNTVVSMPQQVRISALASQLASPPVNVIIATANTSQQQPQQGQTFTLTTVGGAGFPTSLNYTTVPLHNANQMNQLKGALSNQNARLMSGVGVSTLRGIPSKPNGDGANSISSSSSGGSSGAGGTVSGLSALLVNTPAADHPMPGANTASALLERLTASSAGTSPVPADSPTHFTVGPKVQQIPVQLAKGNQVLTPLSSPPPQQTLNVHTLNLTPFQAIPNVQVQIPRLSSPLNSASGSTQIQSHPASLIFSVAMTTGTTTCTSVSPQVNSIATSSLGSNAVVLTNNTAPGSTSPVLPLPIAQLMASGVKGLTHQGLRVSSPNTVSTALAQATGKSVQLVGTLPRNAQLAAGMKQQLAARGLLPAQRLTNTALKMATSNATPAQLANASLSGAGMNIASNSVVTISPQQQQQLQLTLQKQSQHQQFFSHNLTPQQLQTCLNQQQQKTVALSPAAVATKHHRRSNAADPNK